MLLWIEGFEGFGTSIGAAPSPTNVMARKYSSVYVESMLTIQSGRLGGYCIRFGSYPSYFYPPALTTNSTFVVGLAVKFTAQTAAQFLMFYDGATTGMNVRLTVTGELAVYRGSTLLNTTSGLGLQANVWYYIEFKVLCHDSSGSYTLRVGEGSVLTASGIDTQAGSNPYHTTFRLKGTSGILTSFDDLYCLDGSGSDNNDFLGNMRVSAIYPDADTASKDWTRSSGADNYVLVNEAICDDDTDYVESDTTDDKDLYDYANLLGITSDIRGVQINTMCRETDATSFDLVTVVKSGATESDDAGQAIGTTDYVSKRRIVEKDPNTSALWTVAGINAAQFGIKVG